MDNLLSIIPFNHPVIAIVIMIAGFFLFRTLFRATVKLTIIAAVAGVILVGFFGYSPDEVLNKARQAAVMTKTYAENTIKPAIYHGLKNAHIEKGPNGTVSFVGDNFHIGETPQGKFVFQVKSLNLSISQDELANYLNKDEMHKLLQTLEDKKQTNNL